MWQGAFDVVAYYCHQIGVVIKEVEKAYLWDGELRSVEREFERFRH
jgi:hypothetical protein